MKTVDLNENGMLNYTEFVTANMNLKKIINE